MKAFKGIGFQLVLSFAVAVCVAIILVSLGSIRITKTSINANTEVTSEQTLDNVQEGFTTYLKTLSQVRMRLSIWKIREILMIMLRQ